MICEGNTNNDSLLLSRLESLALERWFRAYELLNEMTPGEYRRWADVKVREFRSRLPQLIQRCCQSVPGESPVHEWQCAAFLGQTEVRFESVAGTLEYNPSSNATLVSPTNRELRMTEGLLHEFGHACNNAHRTERERVNFNANALECNNQTNGGGVDSNRFLIPRIALAASHYLQPSAIQCMWANTYEDRGPNDRSCIVQRLEEATASGFMASDREPFLAVRVFATSAFDLVHGDQSVLSPCFVQHWRRQICGEGSNGR